MAAVMATLPGRPAATRRWWNRPNHGVVFDGGERGHVQHTADVAPGRRRSCGVRGRCRCPGRRAPRPARAAMRRRSRRPSSGRSAMSVQAVTGPIPGTERSKSSASRQMGVERTRVVRSWSRRRRASSSHAIWASSWRCSRRSRSRRRRFCSAPSMSTSWRRRAMSSPERLGLGIRHWAGRGADGFGKEGDDPRVEPFGLGQLAGRPGEVADLPGIDDGHGQPGAGQGGGDRDLIAAGGLQDNDGGASARAGGRAAWPGRPRRG